MTIVLTHALVAGTKSLFFVYELGVWPGAGVNVTPLTPPPHTEALGWKPNAEQNPRTYRQATEIAENVVTNCEFRSVG